MYQYLEVAMRINSKWPPDGDTFTKSSIHPVGVAQQNKVHSGHRSFHIFIIYIYIGYVSPLGASTFLVALFSIKLRC